jgi:hypothetical protein
LISEQAARYLEENGWTWKLKDGSRIHPTADDVEKALDEAVTRLYTRSIGHQLEVGHLIVQKGPGGSFSVYVHLGEIR